MKIGVIGTGNMGRALGWRWAGAGHDVMFGSRDPGKARAIAGGGPARARAGDLDGAAAFGEVVLYTVRDVLPSVLLRDPQGLSGKIVIDCNNSAILGLDVPDPQRRPGFHFMAQNPSLAERLAADARGARVVKAFNTVPATVIALDRERLLLHRVSVFLCSDDAEDRSVVKRLAEEMGFIGVDCGQLERAGLVEAVADFIRHQMLSMGSSPLTTISIHEVAERGIE